MSWILFLQILLLIIFSLAFVWSIVSEVMDKKIDIEMIAAGVIPERLREK